MRIIRKFWPFVFIAIIVSLFFLPVFKGFIPFPGDLLINTNPYRTQSYLGYGAGSYPNKAQGPDVINEIYPWKYFSINELKQGVIPFWNSHNFSGNPQMANFQSAVFYPFNFVYFLLPFNLSWTLIIMLQPLLAGFFMYLFLRKGIGLKTFPSVLGAISFAFSSYMTVWIEYGNIGSTFLWLPLSLLFTKYYFKKTNALNFFMLCLILSLSILAGYIQGVFYIYLLCFLYYGYLVFNTKGSFEKLGKNFLFLVSLFLPLLITSFQILPTLQIFLQSTRGAYTLPQIEKNLASLYLWITAFFPDFFGNPATRNYWINGTYIERVIYPGSVMLFFAFYAISGKVKFLEKKFFLIIGVISLLAATNLPFVKYLYLIPIPVVSTTIPTREFSVLIFCIIVLGAMGLELFMTEERFRKKFLYCYAGFLALVWIVVSAIIKIHPLLSSDFRISEHNLIFPTLLILLIVVSVLVKKINKNITVVLLTILVVVDLLYFFNKITPFSSPVLVYPNTPVISYLKEKAGISRFWGLGSAYIPPDYQTEDGTYSPEGNDPLHINYYGQLVASSGNGKIPQVIPRPDANIYPAFGKDDLKNNYYRQRILNLLGVKYVLNQTTLNGFDADNFPTKIYTLIWQEIPWQIYLNKEVLPRYFLTGQYILAKDKPQALSFIYDKNIDLKKTVILEKQPGMPIDKNSQGRIELLSYGENRILFEVTASANSLLFLSDNNYPEWKALVDSKQTEIFTADYAFRAISVPKGKHAVEFIYDPKSFRIGIWIAILGVLMLLAIIYYLKTNEKKL